MTEGSLDVKLPTTRTDGKPEVGRVRYEKRREEKRREEKRRKEKRREEERRGEERKRREEKRRDEKRREEERRGEERKRREETRREEKRREEQRRSEKRKSQKKEDAGARKGRKVAIHCVFPLVCGSRGSKSRLAKAAGAKPSGQMRDKNCTPLWPEAHFEVKLYKTSHARTTFGSWDVEKVHAVVAQSTFRSQNAQKTLSVGPLLEVDMSKKCTPLWREAHFEVKSAKDWWSRTTFGSQDVVLRGMRKIFGTLPKVSKTWRFCSSFKNVGRRGTFEADLRRCISRGRRLYRRHVHQRCWASYLQVC